MNRSAAAMDHSAPAADAETRNQLEFSAALEVVAARARSHPGADRVRARLPQGDVAVVTDELETVEELAELIREGDRFVPAAIADIRSPIERVRVPGSVLESEELILVGRAMESMFEVHEELHRIAEVAPRIGGFLRDVPPQTIPSRIAASFERDGSLSDNASPQLKKARQTVRRVRNQLVDFLQKKIRDAGADSSDGNVTVRGGRYVMPLRRDARARGSGIVHGESASGATVFVEPADAVPLGNELQSAESEQRREEIRVLRTLSDMVREHIDDLQQGWEMCVSVDDVYARARYAVDVRAIKPRLEKAPARFCVRQGRHPLLLAELDTVVPFDVEVESDTRVVLISGPNTGGKTVLLKAVGLLCVLAQAGIIPPVGDGTVLPVFGRIDSDIGDHQSIAASLSTFSGHVQSLRRILERAGSDALVLLDEFGTGTDPAEGAALAAAILHKLVSIGCFTVATTHLGKLKQLGSEDQAIVNASLQFDPDRLEPTYQFSVGVPGRSYGLAMARTLGLPSDVVERAESLQSEGEQSVDALLADLERRELELTERERASAAQAASLAAERDGLDVLRVDLDDRSKQLAVDRKDLETEGREAARRYLLQARKRVEEALGTARAAVDETTAKEARRLVEEGVQEEADALSKLEQQARQRGWRVVRSGRRSPDAKRATQDVPERRRRPKNPPTSSTPASQGGVNPTVTSLTELDLRGMTGDEAEDAVLRAVDAAQVEDLTCIRIIHGKGTGALRERVSGVLRSDGRVESYRTAPPQEGGWGVTIAELKR